MYFTSSYGRLLLRLKCYSCCVHSTGNTAAAARAAAATVCTMMQNHSNNLLQRLSLPPTLTRPRVAPVLPPPRAIARPTCLLAPPFTQPSQAPDHCCTPPNVPHTCPKACLLDPKLPRALCLLPSCPVAPVCNPVVVAMRCCGHRIRTVAVGGCGGPWSHQLSVPNIRSLPPSQQSWTGSCC